MAGALIVTAELAKADLAWLDSLRRHHYPPERNRVPAHLTMFRSLPPSSEREVRRSLGRAALAAAPEAQISGVMDLDSGVALRVASENLESIRDELSGEFHGLLSAQDVGRWTPHITIQNKVEPRVARALLRQMRTQFEPRALGIAGLQLIRYLGGECEPLASYRFRGA
ncbi:MAG: 2'-5' RNA ligase family protein [Sphingomicrobium sp.]